MDCTKEKLGESISFESFESGKCEHISLEEAKQQGAEAKAMRDAESE